MSLFSNIVPPVSTLAGLARIDRILAYFSHISAKRKRGFCSATQGELLVDICEDYDDVYQEVL